MADAYVFVIEHVNFGDLAKNKKENRNTHINIGTGIEISVKDLVLMIRSVVDFKGKVVFNTDKPDGTPRKLTDPTMIHSLGWQHQMQLEDGIKRL